MSIAYGLGLDVRDPQAIIARRWANWVEAEPALAAVGVPAELRQWRERAKAGSTPQTFAEVDSVLRGLARLAAHDGGNDEDAALVLAWVMLPAASQVARHLQDLDPDGIDQIVASYLWILARSFRWRTRTGSVAANIARDLRAAVLRDVGAQGPLRDAHARAVPWDPADLDMLDVADDIDDGDDVTALEVLDQACETETISWRDRALMLAILQAAESAPAGRVPRGGTAGLLNGEVTNQVAAQYQISPRQVRRHATRCLQALTSFVRQD